MADVVERSREVSTELPSVVMALYSWMLIVLNTRGLPVPIKLRGARLVIVLSRCSSRSSRPCCSAT